jgi:hypothetical protein
MFEARLNEIDVPSQFDEVYEGVGKVKRMIFASLIICEITKRIQL